MDNDEQYSLWQFYERSLNRDTAQDNAVPQQLTPSEEEEVVAPAVVAPAIEEPSAVEAPPPPLPAVHPLRGFLFSVSKEEQGEFWPVYEGDNSIGSDKSQGICLGESTIKAEHAVLTITDGEKGCTFMVRSVSADTPVTVNGAPAGNEGTTCYDRDILTVGKCYELLFVAVDPRRYGLAPKADFITQSTASAPIPPPVAPTPPPIPRPSTSPVFPKSDTEEIFHSEDELPRDEGTVFCSDESGEDEGTRIM